MDSKTTLKISVIESQHFDKNFLEILCEQAQVFCKPSYSPLPEEEFLSCTNFFKEIESYIIGENDENVIARSSSNTICGKIFIAREPVYTCSDCSTDETCVLCRVCFIKSEHVKHNYEMHISSGGGYCDCGDEEAWTSFPRCNLHDVPNPSSLDLTTETYDSMEEVTECLKTVSDDIKIRFLNLIKLIFLHFRQFVMRPLCKSSNSERTEELKRELEFVAKQIPKTKSTEYSLVLYNNEFHNFDQVINLFKRCLQCSTEHAMAYANIVDRDGRCMALLSFDREDVEQKQNEILHRSKTQTSMELLCRIHHPLTLSLQNMLIHTVKWLYKFVDRYPMLRMLLCQYLFSDTDLEVSGQVFERCTFIQDIFENYIELWKMARNVCSNFLMTAVFKETYFKKLFAETMTKNYEIMIDHYERDDHNAEDSLISLNCQIFTVISFARHLLESHDILDKIMKIVLYTCLNYSKPLRHPKIGHNSILHFEKTENEIHKKFDPFERRLRALNDLKFLLTSLLSSYSGYKEGCVSMSNSSNNLLWTEEGVKHFMKYFRTFSNFLSLIQDTDIIERATEHHVEHDPNWRTGIIMMVDSIECITLTSQLLVSNPDCWKQSFDVFRQIINTRIVDLESGYCKPFKIFSYTATVVDNEWPSKFMSVIKPLHRFMAAMLTTPKYRDSLTSLEKDCLLDQALQVVVFSSQQAGDMWKRNGNVPAILVQQMKYLTLTGEMFDRDLQLIQQMAICMNPENFILKCIHKFDLKSYIEGDSTKLSDKRGLLQRIEDFLHTLIMTIFYRHRVGVGKNISKEDIYAHTILHILCVKSISHSVLMSKLSPELQKYSKGNLINIIDRVADQNLQSQVVIFSAKTSLLIGHFNRYSPYYSLQDRNKAELWVQNCLKKENLSNAMIPPIPIDLADDSKELHNYIVSPCFIELLNKLLYFCTTKRSGEFWSDTILDMLLYLIGASLHEDSKSLEMSAEERNPLFIEVATRNTLNVDIIANLELLCDKITCDQQLQLIKWIIRKWNDVIRIKSFGNTIPEYTDEPMEVDVNEETTDNAQALNQTKIAKADAAKKRREQLMNKMWKMQKKFINENSGLLMETVEQTEAASSEDCVDHNTQSQKERDIICILCQEKNSEDNSDRPIVLIAGAWRSSVLAKHPFINKVPEHINLSDSPSSNVFEIDFEYDTNILPFWTSSPDDDYSDIDRIAMRSIIPMRDHAEETFISTCGHVMHYDCKTTYMKEMVKQRQNVARTKGVLYPRIYNRCPLCKCVCNIDIPIIGGDNDPSDGLNNPCQASTISFQDWVNALNHWTPNIVSNNNTEPKKLEGSVRWWNKIGNHISNLMKPNLSLRGNDSAATDEDLLSCLGYRTSLAIKLQPAKLTKDTYKNFENIRSSISESSSQDVIELDYAVIYTLSVWEKIMSKQNGSLLTDLSERHADGLKYLIKAVCKSHQRFANHETVSRECQSFIAFLHQMLFDCTSSSFQKTWLESNKYQIPLFILEVDFTYVLGSMLLMRYSFLPTNQNTNNSISQKELLDKQNYNVHVVRFIYQYASIQALLSLQKTNIDNVSETFNQLRSHSPSTWSDNNVTQLHRLRESLACHMSKLKWSQLTPEEVSVCFYYALRPFFRCVAFLLKELGSVSISQTFAHSAGEFNDIMAALNLNLLPFESLEFPDYIGNHLRQIDDLKLTDPKTLWNTPLPHVIPESPPKLIDLPREFTDVITMCLDRGCSLSQQATGTVSEMSICLICGVTVCLSGYCCRRIEESSGTIISGAQIHARQCHEGYSLFLNIRNTKIVVLFYQARWQLYLDPVYLDKFGESDVDFRRKSPLFLNMEAYSKLERSWLDHSVGCIVNGGFFSNDFFV